MLRIKMEWFLHFCGRGVPRKYFWQGPERKTVCKFVCLTIKITQFLSKISYLPKFQQGLKTLRNTSLSGQVTVSDFDFLVQVSPTFSGTGVFSLGSRFRYSGSTEKQVLQQVQNIRRPQPQVLKGKSRLVENEYQKMF